jgi:lipoprotein signal peptidase
MALPTERRLLTLFAILAIVGFSTDQISKYVVFAALYPSDNAIQTSVTVVPGCFNLQTNYTFESHPGDSPLSFFRTISGERLPYLNKGALSGIGNDGEGWNTFFAAISVAAAIFIIFWVRRPTVVRDRWLCIALGLILAGTLANLYDRVIFGGVRDFIHWYYETHIWPDFNIADCCLVCGATVLLARSFFVKDPATEQAKTEPVAAFAPVQTTAPTTGA